MLPPDNASPLAEALPSSLSKSAGFVLHTLPAQGRALPADTDHLLARTHAGELLLIHVPPGEYAYESHSSPEYIVCVDGQLVMQAEHSARIVAERGQMIEVPPGLRHCFAPESNAVILTLAQAAASLSTSSTGSNYA